MGTDRMDSDPRDQQPRQSPAPQPRRSRRRLWITISIVGALLIAAGGTAAVVFRDRLWGNDSATKSYRYGESAPGINDGSSITVFQVSAPRLDQFLNKMFVAADVQVCVGDLPESQAAVSWEPWAIITDANNRLTGYTSAAPSAPTPEYPTSAPVQSGDCVRGWLSMLIPLGAKVSEVRYTLQRPGGDVVRRFSADQPSPVVSTKDERLAGTCQGAMVLYAVPQWRNPNATGTPERAAGYPAEGGLFIAVRLVDSSGPGTLVFWTPDRDGDLTRVMSADDATAAWSSKARATQISEDSASLGAARSCVS